MRGKSLEEIFEAGRPADYIIADLKHKTIKLPSWETELVKEYEPSLHPVMDEMRYPDIVDGGKIRPVARIAYNTQKLVVKRMAGLCFGIPAKINFAPEDDKQSEVATYLQTIMERTRVNSLNFDRAKQLFASCEVFTLWYGVKQPTSEYGFNSGIKLRCRTFSPMNGDELYPLFDAYGDLIAFSIGYKEQSNQGTTQYFDTYTATEHRRWVNEGNGWVEDDIEYISTGKIPGVYCWRPEPLWEDTSKQVYEREWKMSRNGNYLDKNNIPLVAVYADEAMPYGDEPVINEEDRNIVQLPTNGKIEYVTWQQATDALKFHIEELKNSVFEQLQIPNWSYQDMKAVNTSGEGLKQLFIDARLKVTEESGRLIEMLDREVNVLKSFLKVMLPSHAEAIAALKFSVEITPYTIDDEKERISNLALANGGKPMMSQRESVEMLGYSADVDKTMRELAEEGMNDVMAL